MIWQEQLVKLEYNKEWKSAIELMQKTVSENPNDAEAYVRIIYLLHNILVEEDYSESEHHYIAKLLKKYFEESKEKFVDNAEYLFFLGKILYIAEWYFGINDDRKPIIEKRAFKMQKKAFEMDPKNALYEWAYRFSLHDQSAGDLATQILFQQKEKVEWLKSKGFPGKYILESLERNKTNFRENG